MRPQGYITDVYMDKMKRVETQFLMFINILGITALAVYSFLNLTQGDQADGFIELLFAFALLVSTIHLITTNKTNITRLTGSIVLTALVMNNTLSGGFANQGMMWSYIFPGMIFFLIGSRNGLYLSLILFSLLATILSLQSIGLISTPFTSSQLVSHYASMALITVMIYIYQRNNERNYSLTGELNRRLIATNRELGKQSEQYMKAQKKLYKFTQNVEKQRTDMQKMQSELLQLRTKIDSIFTGRSGGKRSTVSKNEKGSTKK
ncbi:hypothetical protein H6763_00275 [Candidatus Nomurabacteria bacterium]|uniref:MASE6 domain-containing protein n=1 Tax=Candidatus Dojkabacteria bacterium TaxID=2099670 RepID=A0A955I3B9_9BACT|nr:hypothetical protein [Candidatus Dojkabacteria bacterium]MCB9790228.1 hypothetical protein [Candidatus Nomurabacteria bacterium]MCB9803251.1 hypothetical protein [Candidatus Nomurabacteria bacterium]